MDYFGVNNNSSLIVWLHEYSHMFYDVFFSGHCVTFCLPAIAFVLLKYMVNVLCVIVWLHEYTHTCYDVLFFSGHCFTLFTSDCICFIKIHG